MLSTAGKMVTFSVKAYSKILLHACKYPHKAVNGVLISDSVPNGTETIVVDAIPLFHQCLGLAPMFEVALAQVRVIVSSLIRYKQMQNFLKL